MFNYHLLQTILTRFLFLQVPLCQLLHREVAEADADAEDGREEDRGGVEGDGEVLGGDRDGLVGQWREAIPCWGRNLGERTRILEGEYFVWVCYRFKIFSFPMKLMTTSKF